MSQPLGPHKGGAWEDREEAGVGHWLMHPYKAVPTFEQCQCKWIKVIQMAGVLSHLPEANVNLLQGKVSCQTSNYICLLLYISSTQPKMTGGTK